MKFVNKTGFTPTPKNLVWGFTLIEVILTIVIISTGLFGMMILFNTVSRGAGEAELSIQATYLARERLEGVIADKVSLGYDGVSSASYPISEQVQIGNRYYTRELSIYEVSGSDLTTPSVNSGYKKIDIVVKWGSKPTQKIKIATLVTRY